MNCLLLFRTGQEEDNSQGSNIERIRENYPNAYRPWTKEDDLALKKYLGEQMEVTELSSHLQRKEGAIRARIKKLGLSNEVTA